jgi:hypothetical protein
MRHIAILVAVCGIGSVFSASFFERPAQAQTSAAAAAPGPAPAKMENGAPSEPSGPLAIAPQLRDRSFDLKPVSKALADEALRLKEDADTRDRKLQALESELDKNKQDLEAAAKHVDECLALLREAADRLGPDAESRVAFAKQRVVVRDLASRAEVHPDANVRKTVAYFEQKVAEMRDLNRALEEARTRLLSNIDRIGNLKKQLEFSRAVAQTGEALKGARGYLDNIRTIAASAQRLANDLDGFGRTPAEATKVGDAKPGNDAPKGGGGRQNRIR